MRMFLYAILDMIKNSKKESCNELANKVNFGVASYLATKYTDYFNNVHKDKIEELDDLFRNYIEEFDEKVSKYNCDDDEGLYLLIAIALNELN